MTDAISKPAGTVRRKKRFANAMRNLNQAYARSKGTHTRAEWHALVRECEGRCVRCGKRPPAGERLTKNHKKPISREGSDQIRNIEPTCAACNAAIGLRTSYWLEFRRAYGWDVEPGEVFSTDAAFERWKRGHRGR